jgi:tRNA threonylcarbamoyladenosine biosynthesis protein TsaB
VKILGLDTAGALAGAAVVEDGRLIAEEIGPPMPSGRDGKSRPNHAETVLPLIDSLFKRVGFGLDQLSGIAVSIGPGSFTGLRIGLSTVKGLVYGSSISVVGVPTLVALASRVTDWNGLVCPLLDARKKEIYTALFRCKSNCLVRVTEDLVIAPENFLQRIVDYDRQQRCLFIGEGIQPYSELIKSHFGPEALLASDATCRSTAFAIARLGEERVRQLDFDPIGPLVPLYLRSSEAELYRQL